MPVRYFRLGKSFRALFYLFPTKKARLYPCDLSHWGSWIWPNQVGQVPVGLFHRSQAVSDEKSFIHEEAEIIRLQADPPRRLSVEQGHQLHRGRPAGAQ